MSSQKENTRICCMCGSSPSKDPSITLHRFPKPGSKNALRCELWAKYCFPNEAWSSPKFQNGLHIKHKMLCNKHFKSTCFNEKKLFRTAVPGIQCHKEIKTITEALPTSKSLLLKPIEDLELQDTPEKTQELPSCSTTVENTDICDDDDDAGDDSDTLVESNVCRVCLAMDVKMYDLNDVELREMFENITGIAVTGNNRPILERLCWECAGRLKAAAAFRNKALLSDALLQGLANTGEQIRKNDITLIKDSEDYLKTAATLTVVEAFHSVDIDPDNDGIPPLSENNDTKIVQNTVKKDFLKHKNESIIEEDIDETDVEDESMNEAPINTKMEYDQFDHMCPNTGEESGNVFLETNPIFSSNIPLKEDTINTANSSPSPSCAHAKPNYPFLGYLLKTPGDREDKVKKHVIKITKRDLFSKIVSKNSKELISAKSKNINVKIGGISKKTSNLKLLKNSS